MRRRHGQWRPRSRPSGSAAAQAEVLQLVVLPLVLSVVAVQPMVAAQPVLLVLVVQPVLVVVAAARMMRETTTAEAALASLVQPPTPPRRQPSPVCRPRRRTR